MAERHVGGKDRDVSNSGCLRPQNAHVAVTQNLQLSLLITLLDCRKLICKVKIIKSQLEEGERPRKSVA